VRHHMVLGQKALMGRGGTRSSVRSYQDKLPNRPKSCAAARARRAKPGAKGAGKAEQSERRAREDYGWGWAGRFNQTSPHNPPKTRPPNTRGSTSPKREPRSERAAKPKRSDARGWAGGATKTAPKIPADPDAAQTPLETRRRSPARCSTPLRLRRCPASRCDPCGSPVQLRPEPWRPPCRHARL